MPFLGDATANDKRFIKAVITATGASGIYAFCRACLKEFVEGEEAQVSFEAGGKSLPILRFAMANV